MELKECVQRRPLSSFEAMQKKRREETERETRGSYGMGGTARNGTSLVWVIMEHGLRNHAEMNNRGKIEMNQLICILGGAAATRNAFLSVAVLLARGSATLSGCNSWYLARYDPGCKQPSHHLKLGRRRPFNRPKCQTCLMNRCLFRL